jgi:hypothetical protein
VNQASHFAPATSYPAAYGTPEGAYRQNATSAASMNHGNNNNNIQPLTPNSSSDNTDGQLEQVAENNQVVATRQGSCTEALKMQQMVALAYPPVYLMKVLLSLAAPYSK